MKNYSRTRDNKLAADSTRLGKDGIEPATQASNELSRSWFIKRVKENIMKCKNVSHSQWSKMLPLALYDIH